MKPLVGFDYEKATQALNFFARHEPGKRINKMKAIKLVWLADRYHLRKYGRPIVNDVYWAMKLGPVASGVKDIVEDSVSLADEERKCSNEYLHTIDKYTVESLHPVDEKALSESDIEALEFSFECFGTFDEFQLSDIAHDYPEWKKFKDKLSKSNTRELMNYLDFFNNPELPLSNSLVSEDKFEEDPEQVENAREIFQEDLKIEQSWR